MLIPVILSGGAGTRLWPVSREGNPKPFMKLGDGESLLLKTYHRAAAVSNASSACGEIVTVTNRDYYFMSKDEFANAKLGDGYSGVYMLEPTGRNTAPAVAMAAHYIADKHGDNALMLILAADHLIQAQDCFAAAVADAVELAKKNQLVTFGIVPAGPETGFGYIEAGENIDHGRTVLRFVEKPTVEKAQAYLAAGNYFWNSGMFCFKAGVILEELACYAPEVAQTVQACWLSLKHGKSASDSMFEIPVDAFVNVPSISIDYAVMEHSDKVVVVPADFGWSDIGSWNAVSKLIPEDANNNRATGEVVLTG